MTRHASHVVGHLLVWSIVLIPVVGLLLYAGIERQPVLPLHGKLYHSVVRVESDMGCGTGVIVAKDGNKYDVLTANHVIEDVGNVRIRVFTHDYYGGITGSYSYAGEVVKTSSDVDLALVRFECRADLVVAPLFAGRLVAGAKVILSGCPGGLDPVLVPGSVGATMLNDPDTGLESLFISTAPVWYGNSGGPVFVDGKVAGIVSRFVLIDGIPVTHIIGCVRPDIIRTFVNG